MKTAVAQQTTPASTSLSPGLSLSKPWTQSYNPRSPAAPPESGSVQHGVTEESHGGSDRGEGRSPGIRYLTDSLIKKLTKQDNLSSVRTLNLSLSKSGGKKFKFIENLDKCERLQVLNLSHNLIEKIEKLEKLHRLQELHLSHNRIRKIEGLEHMGTLQVLNLANNNIDHIPLWLSKKLRSLQSLNLQHNNISSLHEMVKLKSLKNLTELVVAENPVSNLPHCWHFLVFHLRTLAKLDGLAVSQPERDMAHQRFHMEEMERLEQELGSQLAEMEKLREAQAAAEEQLKRQEALSRKLQLQSHEQQLSKTQLERELNTKNELLKRKTVELTRACQKQYELEQELAFHKIDAKFEPLPYFPNQELEDERGPEESPYIGKARHRRNTCFPGGLENEGPQQGSVYEVDSGPHTPGPQVYSFAHAQAEERLRQLHTEIENAEQQILRACKELRHLEEAVSRKRISEAEKEQLRLQLNRKMQRQGQLQSEAEAMEHQLEHLRGEMHQGQAELDRLQSLLETLEPGDPQHAHVKAQISSKSQLLDMMSKRCLELEASLEEVLCRIDKEADEIKDLEQQLTDGQIAANEALKRDLEDIIAGLQEYLCRVKAQAHHAHTESQQLQREKAELQRHLQESVEQCNQLEVVLMDVESAREEVERLQQENAGLREAKGQMSVFKADLEAQLQERDVEVGRLEEELDRLRRLSQMEQAALKAEVEKERQAKENTLAQGTLAVEWEQVKQELQDELQLIQEEKVSLRRQVISLQGQLEQAWATLLSPQDVMQCLDGLRRSIGLGEYGPGHDEDALGHSLGQLQAELERVVSSARVDREEALSEQGRLTQEVTSLQEQLRNTREELQASKAKVTRQSEGEAEELRRMKKELQEAQELQGLVERRLRDTEDERDGLLAELKERDHQVRSEDSHHHLQIQSLEQELREMKRSKAAMDKMAAQQLNAATDQLRSLQGTVCKISQERAEDAEELERSRRRITTAAQDLARSEAEIQLLQRLLRDREEQMQEVDHSTGVQQHDLNRLSRALSRQHTQTKRLQKQLAQAKDHSGNLDELMAEISALRNTLSQQSSFVSNLDDPPGGKGIWYYVPSPPNPPSVESQGTHDSGLGSQYPPSPDRGQRAAGRGRKDREEPPTLAAGGYWIYSPHMHRNSKTHRGRGDQHDSGEESDGGSSISGQQFVPPPGSAIYTARPDGSPLPPGTVLYAPPAPGLSVCPGTVIYGPPPAGAQLVYGPPPSSLTVPLIQAGILLCNVPGHQEMEREHHTLAKQVRELKKRWKNEDRLGGEVQRLQELRADLEQELQELQRAVSRLHRRREALLASLTSLHGQTELEQSQAQHCEVLEEVQCVEKTLSKRRAELREADRLLMEAQSDLKETRAKTRETLQRHRETQRRVRGTEQELEEMERRAQETTAQLLQASHTLRDLQEAVQELQRRRAEEEQTLLGVEEVVSTRDAKFQDICKQADQASESLESLLRSIQEAQGREDQHQETIRELENLLVKRRSELDRLNVEVARQQEEASSLDRKLEQRHKEERLLQENVELRRQSLAEVLRQGEHEAHGLQRHIKELRVELETLSAQKGELGFQLAERRSQVSHLVQEGPRKENTLLDTLAQINQHKMELKNVLEKIRVENKELQDLKLQHKLHLDHLEKNQESLMQVHAELQGLRRAVEQQEAKRERQRQLLEQERSQLGALKGELKTLEKDRDLLKEQCRNLEARRTHAERCLAVAEQEARAAEAERSRVEAEVEQVKHEQGRVQSLRQAMSRDAAVAQQQLEEKTEELNRLMKMLEKIGEDVRAATRRRDELQVAQKRQEEELQDGARRLQESQHQIELLSKKCQELEEELVRQQEQHILALKQEAVETEEVKQEKLQSQVQALEGALAQHGDKVEQVEEKSFQDRLKRMGRELSDRESQLRVQTKVSKAQQVELQSMQDALVKERRRAEKRQDDLRTQLEETEQERAKLQWKLGAMEEVVQDSHQQVRRLQKELNMTSQELLSLKDKLHAQQDGETRRREIREAMRSLKTEVKAELHSGIGELEMPPSDTSDSESHKENCPQLGSLRRASLSAKDELWQGEVLRKKLRQQEDHLKAQLCRRMWSQQEALSQRRQQTENSLQGLRKRVDQLDELLYNSSMDATSRHLDKHPLTLHCASPSESWRLQSGGAHSCSPVRLDCSLPEKRLDKSW